MKNLKILISLFLPLLLLFSCEVEENSVLPEIRLSHDILEVSGEGGNLTLTYSILNPSDVLSMTASCPDSWVKTDVSIENVLSVKVEANQMTEPRETVVSLKYGDAVAEFMVKQQAHEEDPEEVEPFEIEILDVDIETAVVTISPEDETLSYAALCMPAEVYEEFDSEDEVFEAVVGSYWEAATDMGVSISDFLNNYVLQQGEQTKNVNGLYPGSEYYVLAVGMDESATKTTSLVSCKFQSKAIEMNGATFDLSYTIDGVNVIMNVKPSSDEIYYYYAPLKKSDIENMEMSLEESLKEYFDVQIAYGMQVIGMSREEVMMELLSKGESSFEFKELHASSTYVGVAVSVTLQGYLNSEMTRKEFETGNVEMSDNQLTLKVSEIGVDRVNIDITASNDDQYCMMIMPTSTWPGLSPEEYLEKIEGSQSLESHLATGNMSGTVKGLSSDTEYYVLLFGYQNGTATTELVSETFTTQEDGNPEQLTIKAEFSDVLSNSLTARIIPEPDNALYFSALVNGSFDEDDVRDYIDDIAQMYVSMGMAKDRADFLKQMSVRGIQEAEYTKLYAGTEYKVAAIGVYPETGEYATDVLFSESVRTESRIMSDVTIDLVSDKYFDGDEVVAQYPEYSAGKGMAVVPVKVNVTGDVEKYYYHIFLNDITDPTLHPDDAIINALTTQGGITIPETIFYCEYNKPVTIVGVAKGKDGNYGNVYRKCITFSKDGCSDVSEFVAPEKPEQTAPVRFSVDIKPESLKTRAEKYSFLSPVISVEEFLGGDRSDIQNADYEGWVHPKFVPVSVTANLVGFSKDAITVIK